MHREIQVFCSVFRFVFFSFVFWFFMFAFLVFVLVTVCRMTINMAIKPVTQGIKHHLIHNEESNIKDSNNWTFHKSQ
jgi:hypothetical protein